MHFYFIFLVSQVKSKANCLCQQISLLQSTRMNKRMNEWHISENFSLPLFLSLSNLFFFRKTYATNFLTGVLVDVVPKLFRNEEEVKVSLTWPLKVIQKAHMTLLSSSLSSMMKFNIFSLNYYNNNNKKLLKWSITIENETTTDEYGKKENKNIERKGK